MKSLVGYIKARMWLAFFAIFLAVVICIVTALCAVVGVGVVGVLCGILVFVCLPISVLLAFLPLSIIREWFKQKEKKRLENEDSTNSEK